VKSLVLTPAPLSEPCGHPSDSFATRIMALSVPEGLFGTNLDVSSWHNTVTSFIGQPLKQKWRTEVDGIELPN
jgi:hypothetical protein